MLKPPAVRFVCLRPWIRCNHLLPKCRALDLAFYLFFFGRVIFAKHGFVHGKLFEQTDTAPGKGNETKTLQILVESCKCQTPPPEIHMPPAPPSQAAGAGRQFHRAAFSGRCMAGAGGAVEAPAAGGGGLQPLQLRRLGGAA